MFSFQMLVIFAQCILFARVHDILVLVPRSSLWFYNVVLWFILSILLT
uniref:Uncharacterized protein n=1 Tax=Arundo donax TaxID=35708 RepID=A0A0A9A2A9_ARUDO